jgi:hypothetical protein
MRLLALPGRLMATHARLEAVARALSDDFAVHRYAAWPDDPVPHEADEAARVAAAYAPPDLTLAVSFGSLIAMALRTRHAFRARAYVLMGAPLDRLKAEGRSDLLAEQHRAAPTLFIQQTADFTGAFRDLAAVLPAGAEVREIAGADHVYDRAPELAGIIKRWRGLPAA